MNIEQILKTQFPNYMINNASNRYSYELEKITELCSKIDKILVFIKRNDNNEDYFKFTEEYQNTEKINVIFLNKDDIYYYYINNEENIGKTIMSLKRHLLKETDCIICMEKCTNNFISCSQCGNFTHEKCFEQCSKKICSICKHNGFLHYS